ncbi:transglycosylase domain-containing protein [Aeromicrobium stalagmiti]|uniref:transglycosylase domain-containing protein n=1 Tax=Aeromicrobium stalagmiti TaxID=2738988 RepID=UPI0015696129|nr:transglycosylase domain-containing protein [Aeromicrobium stalagmiti]NRQ48997.1 penicillin-binding protein [Aeromicrobium stalagmiti]
MAAQRKRATTTAAKTSGIGRFGNGFRTIGRKIGGRGPWWAKTIRWISFLGVAGVLAAAATFFVLYRAIAIPDANADFQTQTTQVYYSDGKHKLGEFATQDRESITIDQIPASMQAAAIAAEDRSFYTNRGIDLKGIIRAARDNTTSGSVQAGGSTITQQYVKILYLTQERSYTRKVKEAILSIKIHNQLSKKQILEGYLNTIYFGNGAYGVEVAAQTYFGKPASKLNYAQSALLATVINSPSYYDPYAEGAQDRIQPRFSYVLAGMVKSGAITQEQASKFDDRIPKVIKKKQSTRFSGSKGYLLQLVKEKAMAELGLSDQEFDGSGLRIITTFDYENQMKAIESIKALRPDASELQQSLVSVQPGTGAVRAMYAGRDYVKNQLNWATSGTQPGSTFKAFAVVAALEDGYSLKTKLNGNSPLMKDGEQIAENQGDSGGESFGSVDLAFATQKSVNTAFVDLVDQMEDGPNKVLEAASQAGIPSRVLDPVEEAGAPLVTPLGYFPVAPVDMANAYATLAADGKRAEWYVVERVKDSSGQTVLKHKVETDQTIPKDVAADTIAAMQRVVNSGAGGTGSNGRTVCTTAGKTGTATFGPDDDQHVSSSWFAGFTPKLATAVMYNRGKNGNGDLENYMVPFFGGQIPAKTFALYMNGVLDPADCGTFPPAANIKSTKGTIVKPPAPKPTKKPTPKPTRTTQTPKPTPTPTQPTVPPTTEPTPTQEPCGPLDPGCND